MRISRKTPAGTTYAGCFDRHPSPETVAALDKVVDATRALMGDADDALCPGSESYSPGPMCAIPCPECGKKVQRFRQKLQRHRRPT